MRKLFVIEAERDDDGVIHYNTDKQLLDDIMPENGSITKQMFRTIAVDAMNEMIETLHAVGVKMEEDYQAEKAEIEASEAADQKVPEVLN